MKVRDIMTSRVLTVDTNTTVLQAVRIMLQNKISGLPVVDASGNLVGIVTEGDFLRRAETSTDRKRPRWLEFLLGPGRMADEYVHTHARKITDVMTPEPYTATEDTSLEDVVLLMERHRIKRLPVMRGKKIVGVVSRANLLHALATLAPKAPVVARNGHRLGCSTSWCGREPSSFGALLLTSASGRLSSSLHKIFLV